MVPNTNWEKLKCVGFQSQQTRNDNSSIFDRTVPKPLWQCLSHVVQNNLEKRSLVHFRTKLNEWSVLFLWRWTYNVSLIVLDYMWQTLSKWFRDRPIENGGVVVSCLLWLETDTFQFFPICVGDHSNEKMKSLFILKKGSIFWKGVSIFWKRL